ncbi:beta-ketoacyl synthase N-terminal-like domain-containing protein [Cohnella soli]|uniref:Beta-ketoacyl synthase N-terminal-like domain-containing protein n=1 Tax=Cohnella soli TaxID=425005 RepID=A0ABW0I196_9BACL
MGNRHVLVTGTGAVSAGGIGSDALWETILAGRVNQTTRSYAAGDGLQVSYPVYAAPALDLRTWVSPQDYDWLLEEGLANDPDFQLLAVAALLAIDEAKLTMEHRRQATLVIGHENLGVNRLVDRILASSAYADGGSPLAGADPWQDYTAYRHSFYGLQTFPYLFYLAKLLDVRGIGYVVNNACASGLYALELGSQFIRSRQSNLALVVCSDYAHVTESMWLQQKGFGSEKQQLKPFDSGRDGSILGDGAAAVVLEASASASLRATRPWASYAGASLKQDTWQMTLPDYPSHTYSTVMKEASGIGSREPIDLLIPHGTGSTLWDRYEAEEIRRAFPSIPAIAAFKGSIGHTLGANALLEAIALLHCMRDGLIPPTANCTSPDPRLSLPISTTLKERNIRRAMKSVPAYGGFQAAAVFESVREGE